MALEREIETFDRISEELKKHHNGKFVLIKNSQLIGTYDSFENAAREAVSQFGRGPYLIRQVGAPVPALPVSWVYNPRAA
jgi:hypothetical protein